MSTPLQQRSIRNIGSYGIIRESSVDSTLAPAGSVSEARNFHFDRIGAASLRPGLTAIGATVSAGNTCVALHNAQSSILIAAFSSGVNGGVSFSRIPNNNNAYIWASAVFTIASETGVAPTVRFVDFNNYTLAIPVASTGTYESMKYGTFPFTSVISGGNPLNTQHFMDVDGNRASFGEVYKSRIYLAGDPDTPSRLFFSSVIDSAGNISWTPRTDYVDINPGDGESISGLKRYSLELDVFKPNYIYRFRTSGLDPDPLIRIGTRSQESIIEGKKGLYFHHETGFYRYSGGYPIEISRAINDFVAAISLAQSKTISSWKDSDHIYWSIAGNLTIAETLGSSLWRNVVFRYTESSDVWTIYSYAFPIGRGAPFVTSTSSSIAIGLNNGVVAEFNKGLTDVGEAIRYHLITPWLELEGIWNTKTIHKLAAVSEKGIGMQVMYQVDESNQWESLSPELRQLVTLFNSLAIKHHRIRFKVAGLSSQESSVFMGLEILSGMNEGIIYENTN